MIAGSTTGSELIARGHVQLLARWPVKSLSGESLSATRLDGRGFAGDRADAFFELRENGTTLRRLTARQAPQMLLWTATYPSLPDDALIPSTPAACGVTSPLGRGLASPLRPAAPEPGPGDLAPDRRPVDHSGGQVPHGAREEPGGEAGGHEAQGIVARQ
jgi:hypothetical protein